MGYSRRNKKYVIIGNKNFNDKITVDISDKEIFNDLRPLEDIVKEFIESKTLKVLQTRNPQVLNYFKDTDAIKIFYENKNGTLVRYFNKKRIELLKYLGPAVVINSEPYDIL